jgi:hypothetical protein
MRRDLRRPMSAARTPGKRGGAWMGPPDSNRGDRPRGIRSASQKREGLGRPFLEPLGEARVALRDAVVAHGDGDGAAITDEDDELARPRDRRVQ